MIDLSHCGLNFAELLTSHQGYDDDFEGPSDMIYSCR